MIGTLLLVLGLVCVLEGLVFALAPSRIEDLLDALRSMPIEARRLIGLLAVATGVGLIALARALGV